MATGISYRGVPTLLVLLVFFPHALIAGISQQYSYAYETTNVLFCVDCRVGTPLAASYSS